MPTAVIFPVTAERAAGREWTPGDVTNCPSGKIGKLTSCR
jgi:hypothetical protein